MKKRKICVVITARPSYSRIKTVLSAINKNPILELQLVLTGSTLLEKYGSTINIIEKDGFKIHEKIFCQLEGENPEIMAKTTGLAILELSTVFNRLKPDLVITIADRFETLATSIASSYQNIPLAHIQGGEITGSIDEKVRHANTKLADLHFVSSDDAKNRVIKMGECPDTIFNTGCPSMDIALSVAKNPKFDFDPFSKYGGVGTKIDIDKDYLVVMQHPVTTEFENSKNNINETLKAICDLSIPTFWFWPNVDAGGDSISKGLRSFRENSKFESIHFFKNMESEDFLRLIKNSKCLIGNSSVGIRESSLLGVPVVNIGTRQSGRKRSKVVIDVDYNKDEIKDAVKRQILNGHYKPEFIYGNGKSGELISNILSSCKLTYNKKLTY